jgi:hypothetical protein
MIGDSIRTKYDRISDKDDDNETMDLSDPKQIAKLKRLANAHY